MVEIIEKILVPDQLPIFVMKKNDKGKIKLHRLMGEVRLFRANGEVVRLRPKEYQQVGRENVKRP
jgi:hypothetical protein